MSEGRDTHAWATSPRVDGAGGQQSVGRWLKVSLGLWALGLVAAMGFLWKYKLTPGADTGIAAEWPRHSSVHHDLGRPTLLLFAHPRCPCTRASLAELRNVLSPLAGKVSTTVVFFHAAKTPDSFSHTDSWSTAAAIPGVAVVDDPDGREAAAFGARTSGEVALYDASGALRFSGGITPARGHQGDSPGKRRLTERLAELARAAPSGPAQGPATSAVYGCPLEDPP